MVLAISAALAAPLLGMAKLHSFGILVHGPGKAGKSTMLVAAAIGHAVTVVNETCQTFAPPTPPSARSLPRSMTVFLPMNELGLLKGSAKEKTLPLPRLHLLLRGGPRHDVLEPCAD